jgi:hypothetical protein
LAELALTTVVWTYNLLVDTNLKSMTAQQIESKIYYDIVVDRENTNHWLPATLLLLEFFINNIPFSWRHLPFFYVIGTSYIIMNAIYCLYYRVMIYPGVDWVNNWPNALLKSQIVVVV